MTAAEPGPPAAAGTIFRVELSTVERPALLRWSTPVPPQVYDAYAVLTGAGPVLVDPEVAAPEDWHRLLALVGQRPAATVLTSAWHERSAYRLRDAHAIPVWAPAAGVEELEGRPDHLYGDGAVLPGGLRAIGIDGRYAGDTVLRWAPPAGPGVLLTGDVVLGQLNPEDRRAD